MDEYRVAPSMLPVNPGLIVDAEQTYAVRFWIDRETGERRLMVGVHMPFTVTKSWDPVTDAPVEAVVFDVGSEVRDSDVLREDFYLEECARVLGIDWDYAPVRTKAEVEVDMEGEQDEESKPISDWLSALGGFDEDDEADEDDEE